MKEIRLHARAGHGMVTGAELIALAANFEGKNSQAFPFFGSEKRGPPVEAYTRIDNKPITIHEEIAEPDVVIVADPSIMHEVDVCAGLKKDGIVIVNSEKKASELKLNAKRIFTDNVKIESVKRAIKEKLSEKFPQNVVEANINAIQEVYDTMKVEKVKVKK